MLLMLISEVAGRFHDADFLVICRCENEPSAAAKARRPNSIG
jgi:hypothetical protein